MEKIENKKVYRCDSISSVDDFLSAREVLKLEMFGDELDEGLRNFDGVISDIEMLFPGFNVEELMKNFDIEQLEHDEGYRYKFVDWLIELLQKQCNVPEECFTYAIWACDTPEEVVESYDVEPEDVNCYVIRNGVLLQDLGSEGQLYGVAERPECIFEESVQGANNQIIGKHKKHFKYNKSKVENIMENKEEIFNKIYEECVCASGASGISGMAPQHMTAVVDTKAGDVSRFTGGNGGKKVKSEKEVLFNNDTMKVHKKKNKKGDAITGTGVVYANGKLMEAMDKILESFDEDEEMYERERDKYEEAKKFIESLIELEDIIKDVYESTENEIVKAALNRVYDADKNNLRVDEGKAKIEDIDEVAQVCADNGLEPEAERIWDAIADVRQSFNETKKYDKNHLKEGVNDVLIGENDDGFYSLWLSDCRHADHGKDPHSEILLVVDGSVSSYVRTDEPEAENKVEEWISAHNINLKDDIDLSETFESGHFSLRETKRADDGTIESNKDGSVGDWTEADSHTFAYDLIDAGEIDLTEKQIMKKLYDHPYFKDLFEAIEDEEIRNGGSTSNTVGWDNIASDEIEHAAKEVYKVLQDLKSR